MKINRKSWWKPGTGEFFGFAFMIDQTPVRRVPLPSDSDDELSEED